MERFDLAVIGAGAAGLFCAGVAGQRGLRVLLLDHAATLGEKIRISGGGRCNFTNLNGANHGRYLSCDPRFARHALRAYPPQRFVTLVRSHRISFHEKHRGQLFCDQSSRQIIDLLRSECESGRVSIRHPVRVHGIERHGANGSRFTIVSDHGRIAAANLVLATGGLSVAALGATDFAWRQAAEWQLEAVPARPGLVPLTFSAPAWRPFVELAGVSLPVSISVSQPAAAQSRELPDPSSHVAGHPLGSAPPKAGMKRQVSFLEDLLFTHRGLSGPAVLQISSYWRPGQRLVIDLLPGQDIQQRLIGIKEGVPLDGDGRRRAGAEGPRQHPGEGHRQQLATILGAVLPRRLAQAWITAARPDGLADLAGGERLAQTSHAKLRLLARALHGWEVEPAGSEGYRKAEVTLGGIATRELDPRTLQALRMPGLYCIGEAVDVTGWLGGYNFQWAWSSAFAAATAMPLPSQPHRQGFS